MAGRLRYLKEKNGRFFARMAVPARLQPYLDTPRSQLSAPLGPDRRTAERLLAKVVTQFLAELEQAERRANGETATDLSMHHAPLTPLTTADFGKAVWERYVSGLAYDERRRETYASKQEIEAARQKLSTRVKEHGEDLTPLELLDFSLDYLVLQDARKLDRDARELRLKSLRKHLADGEVSVISHEIEDFLYRYQLAAPEGSAEWNTLAQRLLRTEIEILQRSLERDDGDFGGQPRDPIIKPVAEVERRGSVLITHLWEKYLRQRMQAGYIVDGGRRQQPVIRNLIAFLGHEDAAKITRKQLLDWRDHLLAGEDKSAKTVNDIYLSTIRALFKWAHEEELLTENVAENVRQAKRKPVQGRERGYTDAEALLVLRASRAHVPKPNQFGFIRETAHMTAAKRWAPLLCAFSGARISEITQLRKEDFRVEQGRLIMRITPDAGTVKTRILRDVPLHRQILKEGFSDFLKSAQDGPLFHGATDPAQYAKAASSISDNIAKWLRRAGIAPEGVQPNHGWRHRLKTMGRALGLSERVIDAIQGHAARTAGDNYGDVNIEARLRVIDALPDYPL